MLCIFSRPQASLDKRLFLTSVQVLTCIFMKVDTRNKILAAAKLVFARSGFLGATTSEIAREAKVNEVTLFRHFKNKGLLYSAVISECVAAQKEILGKAIRSDEPLEEVLLSVAEAYHTAVINAADFIRISIAESQKDTRHPHRKLYEVVKPFRDHLQLFFLHRQKAGEIHPKVNCEIAMDAYISMFFGNAIKPRLIPVTFTVDEYRRFCVKTFVRGLKP